MDRVRWRAQAVSDRAGRGALLVLLTAALLAVGTSSASAVIVAPRQRQDAQLPAAARRGVPAAALRRILLQPRLQRRARDAVQHQLHHLLGPLRRSPAYPAEYQSGINQYLEDLAHDSGGHANVDSVSAQYNDAAGEFATTTRISAATHRHRPLPGQRLHAAAICLTDAQLQSELTSFVTAHGLPHDLTHEYFLLTPPASKSCFEAAGRECSAGSQQPRLLRLPRQHPARRRGEIIYANDPYRDRQLGLRRRQPPQRPLRRRARGRAQPRAQRVDHRPRTEQRLDGHRRQRRRDRRQVRGARWARRSAKPRRREIQPGDQRPLLLVSGGVEQPGQRMPAAVSPSPEPSPRRPSRARRARATTSSFDATRLDGAGRGRPLQLAVQRRSGPELADETTTRPSPTRSPRAAPTSSR